MQVFHPEITACRSNATKHQIWKQCLLASSLRRRKNQFPKQLTFAVVFSRHNAECSFDSFVLPELFFCRALTVQCLVESADVESAHVLSEHYNADTVWTVDVEKRALPSSCLPEVSPVLVRVWLCHGVTTRTTDGSQGDATKYVFLLSTRRTDGYWAC